MHSVALLLLSGGVAAGKEVIVKTTSGAVSGEVLHGVNTFRGIPYAEPPTGDLRWRHSKPVKPLEVWRARRGETWRRQRRWSAVTAKKRVCGRAKYGVIPSAPRSGDGGIVFSGIRNALDDSSR
jgi:hypothetical protein